MRYTLETRNQRRDKQSKQLTKIVCITLHVASKYKVQLRRRRQQFQLGVSCEDKRRSVVFSVSNPNPSAEITVLYSCA